MWMLLIVGAIACGGVGYGVGAAVTDRRTRRLADSYMTRARTRLVLAEQLEERAALLLASVRTHHDDVARGGPRSLGPYSRCRSSS
jgi:heme O synthase-like polyprenyltransferase